MDTFLRDVQRRQLVEHVGAGHFANPADLASFIGRLQDRGFRIVPTDGDAGRWFAEHQVEGDPVTTHCKCTVVTPPGHAGGLQFSAGCPLHGEDDS